MDIAAKRGLLATAIYLVALGREGALYPDIFFAESNGGGLSDVSGYANLGGT